MDQKKERGLQDQGRDKNAASDIKTEARRRASEQGRDWKTMSKEERKAFKQEARAALNK